MKRPSFLSSKGVKCDFCGLDFIGNINKANLFMCDRCVRYLCSCCDEEKLKFLEKFKGEKDKEKLIKRFINEEVIGSGEEAKDNSEHIPRMGSHGEPSWYKKNKIWKM